MTAFYVFRAMFMTFFGEYRGHAPSARIARCMMSVPLVVLAVLSLVGGFLFNVPQYPGAACFPLEGGRRDRAADAGVSVAAGLAGIALAYLMYVVEPGTSRDASRLRSGALYTLVYNKYFVDEVYDAAVVQPAGRRLAHGALATASTRG